MAVFRLALVLLLGSCAAGVLADDAVDGGGGGLRVMLKLYDECSKAEDAWAACLKRKAVTFFDRLGRMERLTVGEGVAVVRDARAASAYPEPAQGEARAADDQLDKMLLDRVARFVGTRTLEVTMPKFAAEDFVGEGRKKQGGGKGGGMMHGMMMGIAAKMAALIPIAIAGLFLLAGKALITAKIALLLAGIIAIKKLFAAKQGGGGGGHGGGWQSGGGGGGGGGWQSSGGWDKRSFQEAHKLAYKAYAPK